VDRAARRLDPLPVQLLGELDPVFLINFKLHIPLIRNAGPTVVPVGAVGRELDALLVRRLESQ